LKAISPNSLTISERSPFLNQRVSAPYLYSKQQQTFKTVQAHEQVKGQVRDLTHLWEFLPLESEEMKGWIPAHLLYRKKSPPGKTGELRVSFSIIAELGQ
jgi:hypothetical protein